MKKQKKEQANTNEIMERNAATLKEANDDRTTLNGGWSIASRGMASWMTIIKRCGMTWRTSQRGLKKRLQQKIARFRYGTHNNGFPNP
jgi:hypothetical protein